MASRPRRSRRLMVAAILGAILAGEITGIALGRTLPPVVVPIAAPAGALAAGATADRAAELDRSIDGRFDQETVRYGIDLAARGGRVAQRPAAASLTVKARTKTSPVRAAASHAKTASGGASKSFHGTNRVWIPTLGINRSVQSFPCSRTRPPDAGVYRWGCAGHNNVYLMSHAWSTFRPLHDAYVRGTLHKGMRVWYADGGGRVHEYRVIWWKITAPTTAASWAWASLSSPGMTLQTCVGANSQYRLMVRLDRVD